MILSVSDVKNIVDSVLMESQYKRKVNRIGVFGSTARGTARGGSDVDLLIDFNYEGDPFDYFYLCEELQNSFKAIHKKPVSLVEAVTLGYEENMKFSEEVLKEVVWVYGEQ